jgi:hypothetical protein
MGRFREGPTEARYLAMANNSSLWRDTFFEAMSSLQKIRRILSVFYLDLSKLSVSPLHISSLILPQPHKL